MGRPPTQLWQYKAESARLSPLLAIEGEGRESRGLPDRVRDDDGAQCHSSANVYGSVEPLRGWRHREVTSRRRLVDEFCPRADAIALLDHLNTYTEAALDETRPFAEGGRLTRRLEFHHTLKHGSWLNAVKIKFAALSKQCLDWRIGDIDTLGHETAAWTTAHNAQPAPLAWQFSTSAARIKLKHLCPAIAP